MRPPGVLLLSVRPGEWGFVGVTFMLALLSVLGLGRWSNVDDLVSYGGLFLAYAAVLAAAGLWGEGPAPRTLRIGTTVLVAILLYGAMADLAFRWIPYDLDSQLSAVDRTLFGLLGMDPPWTWTYPRWALETSSWIYIFVLLSFQIAMLLGFIFRPKGEKSVFYGNLVFLYTVAYLGYFFLPARGPIASLGEPGGGGLFHSWVLGLVQTGGGPHGAMPSVHAAAPSYFCIHDLSHRRFSGCISAVAVCAIGVSTLVLRYHYFCDFLAGVLLAGLCHRYGTKITERWLRISNYRP